VLTTLYKQRHEGQDTGLNELIGSVLNKPLPLPGQEPPLPEPAATAADGTGGTTTSPTTPAGGTAKPVATPTPKPTPAAQKPPRT
jgi:hypothetical protein